MLLARRFTWAEFRVFFPDPRTGFVCSLPAAWTDQDPPDPFLQLAAGRLIMPLVELQALVALLRDLPAAPSEPLP